jgi:hypothetical protein
MSNPRLNAANAAGIANAGATDFTVDQVIKSDQAKKFQKQITVPRYVPVDAKAPPKYLLFCDETNGQLDPYRGTPVRSPALAEYLREAVKIDPKDSDRLLAFAGKHLDNADADIAADAYMEFAKANDAEVLRSAKALAPEVIRKLIADLQTPADRLGLLVYLLGACGTPADAELLKQWLRDPGERFRGALGGAYAGLAMLRPAEGWLMIQETLQDARRPFAARMAALSALRFLYNANPKATQAEAITGLKVLLPQEDIADLAIDDLRKWELWSLTPNVLGLFDMKSHAVPMIRRGIVRFALCSPGAEAKQFIAALKLAQPELVKDVEESLQFERMPGK